MTGTANKVYTDAVRFFAGRLQTDLVNCTTPLPPGVGVAIDLTVADQSSRLMCESNDPEKYELKISSVKLMVPVATLSAGMGFIKLLLQL